MLTGTVKTAGVRVISFDLLHTLITLRWPIHVQYASVFKPHLGTLDPDSIKQSFKTALRNVQREKPAYVNGTHEWWGDVIKRTALGAGADPGKVEKSLGTVVPRLLRRFSSKEGYKLFDDVIPTLKWLRETLHLQTVAVSNADSRMRDVICDLGLDGYFDHIILSEDVKVEKPDSRIFLCVLHHLNNRAEGVSKSVPPIRPQDCLHIGDEIESDYNGARRAGMQALLIRRLDHDNNRYEPNAEGIDMIQSLLDLKPVFSAGQL